MGRPSGLMRRISQEYERKYQARIDTLLQMSVDAAMLAAGEMFGLGPKRAAVFQGKYREILNEIARDVVSDAADDAEFVYAKEKIDRELKKICGDAFVPWEERYG